MKILGIIPARSGSKGVPGKNVRHLLGRPLIAWTIDEAKGSKHINRLIVSTDCPKIADTAISLGAEVPFIRPTEFATDQSPDIDVITHALDLLRTLERYEPDIIVRLPPTSPLRLAKHIDQGIETLLSFPTADSLRPITDTPKHPYKMWRIDAAEGLLKPLLDVSLTGIVGACDLPRQVLPRVYVQTGAMDIIRLKTIRELKSTSGPRVAFFYMQPEESVNIDSELDFLLAELLIRKRQGLDEADLNAS